MSSGTLPLDRHVLSSGPALVDSGKDTYGWSRPLAGEPMARLKNAVPWGVAMAGADAPPRLEGEPGQVLAQDYMRLHFAWLPLGGRMGFCIWGAVGERPQGRGIWRVLTHTMLLDEAAFAAVAGNPFAIILPAVAGRWFGELVRPGAFDEPREIDQIQLAVSPNSRAEARALRRRDVARLREALRRLYSAEALADRLTGIYAALSTRRPVALFSTGDGRNELLARLAWLTLPPSDRWRTSFSTEQGASAAALPRLMVLDPAEWEGRVPADALVLGDDTPASATPPEGQRFWARRVASDLPLPLHERDHRVAARHGFSLLDGDRMERLARFRTADEAVRQGRARDAAGLRSLVQAGPGLLGSPMHAGILLGRALRGAEETPPAGAQVLAAALRQLPGGMQTQAARWSARVLQAGSATDRQTAGLARCAAVIERLVPVAELGRFLDGREEAALLPALLDHPLGPAALQAAVAVATDPATVEALAPLEDAATFRLTEDELRKAFDASTFESVAAAEGGVRRYEAAARNGREYWPAAAVLSQLLDFTERSPRVKAYLARPEHLPTVLSSAFAPQAGAYLDAVAPDAHVLARTLVRMVQRALDAGWPPALRTAIPSGTAAGRLLDERLVAQAVKHLSTRAEAQAVIDALEQGGGPVNSRLLLLAHPAWGDRARSAAACLLTYVRDGRVPAAGEAPAPRVVAAVLEQFEGVTEQLPSAAEELVAAALSLLVVQGRLSELGVETGRALTRRLSPRTVAKLTATLAQAAGERSGRAEELSHDLLTVILSGPVPQTKLETLRSLLESLPLREYHEFWTSYFHRTSAAFFADRGVLPVLSRLLEGRAAAPYAAIVLRRALRAVPARPDPHVLEAVERLAWTELFYLKESAFDESSPAKAAVRAALLVQLIGRPATFPLTLHLAAALQQLVEWSQAEPWRKELRKEWILALRATSPSSYRLVQSQPEPKKVIFVPPGFRVEHPGFAVDGDGGQHSFR